MKIHKSLCCPGVTRLFHFVKQKNLPYTLADCNVICKKCQTCAEIKPKFFKPPMGTLIKATQPMERLSIDFKGPLPSVSRNKYFLCIIDEFSRFPFCYPCPDMSTKTVIKCLDNLFYTYGVSGYVHSDRWTAFKSDELKSYFLSKGVASSMSTPYHPLGNSQVERYNGVIWKAVRCGLRSENMEIKHWEKMLPKALHSVRSLLCTSSNQTPHERFFNFKRKSTLGTSLPSWLTSPGPVLLRNFVPNGKNDELVKKVYLTEANPLYARVKFPEGREGNVSLRDLAPCPNDDSVFINDQLSGQEQGTSGHSTRGFIMPETVLGNPDRTMEAPAPNNLPWVEGAGETQGGGSAFSRTQHSRGVINPKVGPPPSNVGGGGRNPDRQLCGPRTPPILPTVDKATSPTDTRPQPRQSARSNRGVPPSRFGSSCSFIWEG